MNTGQRPNKKGDKIYFFYDNGRGKENRPSANVWIWTHPKTPEQKSHNKEVLKIIEVKKSQATIEQQAIGTPVIPAHKFKGNFIDYFEDYITLNKRDGNRHLSCCLSKLKLFIGGSFLAPVNVTENFCKRFRRYLLDNLTGQTLANCFARFKCVADSARPDGYFRASLTLTAKAPLPSAIAN